MAKGDPGYYDEAEYIYNIKLEKLVSRLPPYCSTYFNAGRNRHLVRTLIGYAYDLQLFLYFLTERNPLCRHMDIRDIPLDLLGELTVHDIEEYGVFLRQYKTADGRLMKNGPVGIRRKMYALSTFFNYFRVNEELPKNPLEKYEPPSRPKDLTIVRLDDDEIDRMLTGILDMSIWVGRQKYYHAKTRNRDYAIYMLLLGTGIRVSELIGLNLKDINFPEYRFRIIRKGNKKQDIWMNEEVADAIQFYINHERKLLLKGTDNEPALFLSMQGRRITARQIEKMTEQIAAVLFPHKHITPHKMRSTYGTALYRETNDIYAVATALGHSSVETTRKHYAEQDLDKIKMISINHKVSGGTRGGNKREL